MSNTNDSLLIEKFLPHYRIRQVDRVHVSTDTQTTWDVVRKHDLHQPFFAKTLFTLRVLPEALSNVLHGRRAKLPPRNLTIEEVTHPGSGFRLLGEIEGREVVVGSIGQWWKSKISYEQVSPVEFAEFDQPDFGKLVWNLRVDASVFGGSWISFELRITGTDQQAWNHFRPYWKMIGPFSHAIRKGVLASLERELGSVEENKLRLPGDDILPQALYESTLSKTMESPPERIWPWLVQMGCRRAGWYSIDLLDNGGVPSAKVIHPEFQNIAVGDILPATPKGEDGFAVLEVEENKNLILGSPSLLPFNEEHAKEEPPFQDTWAFVLEPIGSSATRLVTRVRANYKPSLKTHLMTSWITPAHQIMQRVQLNNLNRRTKDMYI